ncbi:MAG: hypothetical protein HYZ48_02305, partial [Chlamydiales bacterium]|nr:hypothetical protein [Chlamydiales bacterium]
SSKLTYNEAWGTPPLNQEEVRCFVDHVFSQPFYYLGSGEQCYVFQSEDKQVVLKFFKMHQLLPKEWLNRFPFSLFNTYHFNHVERRKQLIREVFSSIKTSYDHLQEETGLLFIHLNKTRDLKKKATLYDKRGKKYLVDLDSKEFFLQRSAVKVYDHLVALMEEKEIDRVYSCIRSLFELVIARCKSGMADLDIGIRNNYGFIDDQAMIIDCGSLVPEELIKQPHYYQREVFRVAEAMNHWAQTHYLELVPIIQDELYDVIQSLSDL